LIAVQGLKEHIKKEESPFARFKARIFIYFSGGVDQYIDPFFRLIGGE
jgi:hypothetical protein